MNKLYLILVSLFIVSVASVSAETFEVGGQTSIQPEEQLCDSDVGEIKQLTQLSMESICDYDTTDGNGVYCYCTWQASDSQSQTMIPMINGDVCPNSTKQLTLVYGDNSYDATITSINLTNSGQGWQFGSPQILNETSESWNACYDAPDPNFVAQIVAFILNWLCNMFPQFGFCP